MFFENLEDIYEIAKKTDFSIFCLSSSNVNIDTAKFGRNSLIVSPNSHGKITIDSVREVIDFCKLKRAQQQFIVVSPADAMNEQAQNAFLKLLEEPLPNYHFILITSTPSSLLGTILSRGELYILKEKNILSQAPNYDETIKKYAKLLISAKSKDLSKIVKEIAAEKEFKKSEKSRKFVMEITGAAIEILYKSYFSTQNPNFVMKLPAFLKLYDNLKQNGNIKLHLVADLC